MNKLSFGAAFLLGAAAVVWMAAGFVGSDVMAFTVTAVIGAVYVLGWIELRQYRRATVSLEQALATVPPGLTELSDWLNRLDLSLQNAVRLRIEGERVALPGPVFTPYLVGLLVMLGLLGTFVGMVVTLNGAVLALESTTELHAIREGLAAPIKGLGLAFGTSVAGVAASAMLGLMSTLSRRERVHATRELDHQIATTFRPFSLVHNRQETYKALQQQAQALPLLVDRLQQMGEQLASMGQQISHALIDNQQQFHQGVQGAMTELARSVDGSLKQTLADSGRMAGESLAPILAAAMQDITQQARSTQEDLRTATQEQLTALGTTASTLLADQARQDGERLQQWKGALDDVTRSLADQFSQQSDAHAVKWEALQQQLTAQQKQQNDALQALWKVTAEQTDSRATALLAQIERVFGEAEALVQSRIASEQQWLAESRERMQQVAEQMRIELVALRDAEAGRAAAAVDRLAQLETVVAQQLASLGQTLEQPMARLIETASEAPRAAADVIAQLRRDISANLERDNALIEERNRLIVQLTGLLDGMQTSASAQQQAVESLVTASRTLLDQTTAGFADKVSSETEKLSGLAAQLGVSSTEVASLGEAFGVAVATYQDANNQLLDNLGRIEEALANSATRSDEQLAYYVTQAREIIDLSMLSQKEIFEELRRLQPQRQPEAEEVV
ncbi:MAG: hypothetical protein R3F47_09970 [Gammaproteobacteria bacterium]